jgi:hypothetical protein
VWEVPRKVQATQDLSHEAEGEAAVISIAPPLADLGLLLVGMLVVFGLAGLLARGLRWIIRRVDGEVSR